MIFKKKPLQLDDTDAGQSSFQSRYFQKRGLDPMVVQAPEVTREEPEFADPWDQLEPDTDSSITADTEPEDVAEVTEDIATVATESGTATPATVTVADVITSHGVPPIFLTDVPPLPDGYLIDANGSLFVVGDNSVTYQITDRTPIAAVSQNRTHNGFRWGLEIHHRDADGRLHKTVCSMSDVVAGRSSIVGHLADTGLVVLPGMGKELLSFIQKSRPDKRVTVANQCGWLGDDNTVFVMPNQIIGDVGGEQVLFQQEQHSPTTESMRAAGTLEQWQSDIAEVVKSFPLAMFVLMAAFVGPLLRVLRQDSAGFHAFGPSSRGKSTLLQIAASVWGRGSDPSRDSKSFVQRWLQTSNALEAIASCHSDILVCLDELGSFIGDLGCSIYMMASGTGKASMDSHRRLKQTRYWRGNILSSGEKTVRDAIEESGKQVKTGQLIRLIDLPAENSFELPGGGNSANQVNDLKERCASIYGTAGPEMVRRFIDSIRVNPDQVLDDLRADFDATIKALTPEGATPEQGRAIRRFAVVEVAGKTAATLGVLQYSAEEIRACVLNVRDRYLSYSPAVPDSQRGLAKLQEFLIVNHNSFPSISNKEAKVTNAKGFTNDKGQFLMTETQLVAASGVGASGIVELAKALNEKKHLAIQEVGRLKIKHKVASAGDKHMRFYTIKSSILEADFGGEDRAMALSGNSAVTLPVINVPVTNPSPVEADDLQVKTYVSKVSIFRPHQPPAVTSVDETTDQTEVQPEDLDSAEQEAPRPINRIFKRKFPESSRSIVPPVVYHGDDEYGEYDN